MVLNELCVDFGAILDLKKASKIPAYHGDSRKIVDQLLDFRSNLEVPGNIIGDPEN